jgi:hypothetical protein
MLTTGKLLCGPVILKVDSGPGRMVASAESIRKRAEYLEMGLLILMGLPNATSVQQEMDIIYQGFKAATYARGHALLTYKLMVRGRKTQANRIVQRELMVEDAGNEQPPPPAATTLNIGFDELSVVVNGIDGDPLDMRPFSKFFTQERIIKSWEKVGFVPFTRKCLLHPKVRHELGQDTEARATELEQVQCTYGNLVTRAEEDGLNAGVFDAFVPTAVLVQRMTDEDAQVRELVEKKGAFSASALWNVCATRIGNASVVIKAQQEHVRMQEEKTVLLSQTRTERRAKLLLSAQEAHQKYIATNGTSLTDKDWGNIVRWVLPEAGVVGVMKDLKKKEAIIEKLATLDRDWKTYIPPIVHV